MRIPADPTEYEHLAQQADHDAHLSTINGDTEAAEYQAAFAHEMRDYARELRTT